MSTLQAVAGTSGEGAVGATSGVGPHVDVETKSSTNAPEADASAPSPSQQPLFAAAIQVAALDSEKTKRIQNNGASAATKLPAAVPTAPTASSAQPEVGPSGGVDDRLGGGASGAFFVADLQGGVGVTATQPRPTSGDNGGLVFKELRGRGGPTATLLSGAPKEGSGGFVFGEAAGKPAFPTLAKPSSPASPDAVRFVRKKSNLTSSLNNSNSSQMDGEDLEMGAEPWVVGDELGRGAYGVVYRVGMCVKTLSLAPAVDC